MPFVLNDGTKPPNFTKPLAPAPHKLYDHAREKGEFISQTVRESTLPDYAVNLDNPVDAAPIATANAKADRPLLPVFKHAIPLNDPIAPVRLPMRVKLSPQEEKESKQWRKAILRAMASLPPSVMVTATLPRGVLRVAMTSTAILPAMVRRVRFVTS